MSRKKLSEAVELTTASKDNCIFVERAGVVKRAKVALLGDTDTLRDIVIKIFNDIKEVL